MESAPRKVQHLYKVERVTKSYTVYELESCLEQFLTTLIRIEEYRKDSNSTGIQEYLRLRDESSWNKSSLISGLRPTSKPNLFYADAEEGKINGNSKTLIMFYFDKPKERLIVDVYKDFYPYHPELLQQIISSY